MSEPSRRVAAATVAVGAVLALSACSGSGARAGGTATSTTTSPATSTAHPTTSAKPTSSSTSKAPVSQADVVGRLPGPADGSCTTTVARNVRSGSLGAGDFDVARKAYKDGGTGIEPATVTLHVIPAHPGSMPELQVEMTRLRKPVWYRNASTSKTGTTSGGVKYYVLTFEVPVPGNWRLEMAAGDDKGCFEVAFNRPS